MKTIRKLTVLVLTLAIIAMFCISASASTNSFTVTVHGDFQESALFYGTLTMREAEANAVFGVTGNPNIVLRYQHILIEGQIVSSGPPYTYALVEDDEIVYGDDTVAALAITSSSYQIRSAKYYYDAYYIANGVVDCYLNHGPVTLTNS